MPGQIDEAPRSWRRRPPDETPPPELTARLARLVFGPDAPTTVTAVGRRFHISHATVRAVAEGRPVSPLTVLAMETLVARLETEFAPNRAGCDPASDNGDRSEGMAGR
jgi:hypothetical protein